MLDEIKHIIDANDYHSESKIRKLLSVAQLQWIDAHSDMTEPLKTRVLRSIGYGGCEICGKKCRHMSAKRFEKYCSDECRNIGLRNFHDSKKTYEVYIKNEHLIGTTSTKTCKGCGLFTKFEKRGGTNDRYYAYAPSFCNDECKKNSETTRRYRQIDNMISRMDDAYEYVGDLGDLSQAAKHLIRFKACGHTYPVILRNITNSPKAYQNGCPDCGRFVSLTAKIIQDILEETNIEFTINDRKQLDGNKELDFFIPSFNLGIEVNGIWWHSSFYKPNDYHLDKTLNAEKNGIKLLHFFSDEIEQKTNIVKSIILNALGKSNKIYARKCIICAIDSSVAKAFFNENHLQGATQSSVQIGLFYDSQLVSVMSFRKPFLNDTADWEIARFASKLGMSIIGGASKMLKYFRAQHQGSIMTYADRRYSAGNTYEKLGFKFTHYSPPGFSYVVNGMRESRFKFQKHKLKEMPLYDTQLSEELIMIKNGYPRIYDCGNSCWFLT